MVYAHKIAVTAIVALFALVGVSHSAYAVTLPHLYECTDFDYIGGTPTAYCSAGVVSLTGGSGQVISNFYSAGDPNLKDTGSVYMEATVTGTGTAQAFLMSYPNQVQGTFINLSSGTNIATLPQPSTADTNVGLVIYANTGFTGDVESICVDIVNPPVCTTPPEPDNTATSTPDSFSSIFFYGFIILMFGVFTPIIAGQYIDRRGA